MKTTLNYGFQKPDLTDLADIGVLDGTIDAIDAKIKVVETAAGAKEPAITVKKTGFNLDKSDSVSSTSSTTLATSAAVKAAMDQANSAFQSANSGKDAIRTAIIGKGVPVIASPTHAQLAAAVSTIPLGQGVAVENEVLATRTFSNSDGTLRTGTMPNQGGASIVTPGIADIIKPYGYYWGPITVLGDPDLLPANIKSGANIFGVIGKSSVVETSDATAAASDILVGKTSYINGSKITGSMPNNGGASNITPSTINQVKPAGYYSGATTVLGDTDLAAANIKPGVNIFGVVGTFTSDGTAGAADILAGKTGYINGVKVTGSIPNRGMGFTVYPDTADQELGAGYYSTPMVVAGDADLSSENIKAGVNIFGVDGSPNVVDTTEAAYAAAAAQIRNSQVAFVNGAKIIGTLAVQSGIAQTITPSTVDQVKPAGIYDGDITISGDANLVAANIRAGSSIFGVVGATNVVDTTEATAPAAATQIRSGKVAYINGAKVTGTLAVQSTTTQTITPGATNIVKAAGIYDGAITVKGDANLKAANIPIGITIFGIVGTNTQKKWAKGTKSQVGTKLTVTGLTFAPDCVIAMGVLYGTPSMAYYGGATGYDTSINVSEAAMGGDNFYLVGTASGKSYQWIAFE